MNKATPFVKWAGGERQIMDKLLDFMPKNINTIMSHSLVAVLYSWN